MNAPHVRVLVVVGYPLIRHGIRLILGEVPWLAICGETMEAAQARRLCESLRPDFVVLDMELENGDGLNLLRDFPRLRPDIKVLALSEREDAP